MSYLRRPYFLVSKAVARAARSKTRRNLPTYYQLEATAAQLGGGDALLKQQLDERLTDERLHQTPGDVRQPAGHRDA